MKFHLPETPYFDMVEGDLFDADAPAIGHGVNLAGVMGAGIAREFAHRWPDMVPVYRQACLDEDLTIGGFLRYDTDTVSIYNMATQVKPGRDARMDALRQSTIAAVKDCLTQGYDELALPQIGCGIGGLQFEYVANALAKIARLYQMKITIYTPNFTKDTTNA